MIYYRVALRGSQSATWRWKSSPLTSLDGVLGTLKLYHCMPREHIRVFLSTSPEQMELMLRQENQGLLSTAIPVDQLWDRYRVSWIEVKRLEMELGAGAIMIVHTSGACLPQGRRYSPGRSCEQCESMERSRRRWFLVFFGCELMRKNDHCWRLHVKK